MIMRNYKLQGQYRKNSDEVRIIWNNHLVMTNVRVSERYTGTEEEICKAVIKDNQKIANEIIRDFKNN